MYGEDRSVITRKLLQERRGWGLPHEEHLSRVILNELCGSVRSGFDQDSIGPGRRLILLITISSVFSVTSIGWFEAYFAFL